MTSPQLGHGNFTAPSPGKIVREHQEQVGMRMTFSLAVVVALITLHFEGRHAVREGYKLIAEKPA